MRKHRKSMLQSNSEIKAPLNEIFTSVQGEGIFIGKPQFFIRFSGCPLKCKYCDTKHEKVNYLLTPKELYERIPMWVKSISLTGGEPLLHDNFIKKFLEKNIKREIFLETSGTMPLALKNIIDGIDIVSMDLKPEANMVEKQIEFAKIANKKILYFKIVITENTNINSALKYIENFSAFRKRILILQPETSALSYTFKKCYSFIARAMKIFPDTRIIPQVHTWLKIK